jgi:hypothetical protein
LIEVFRNLIPAASSLTATLLQLAQNYKSYSVKCVVFFLNL